MDILYVTPLWSAFQKRLTGGKNVDVGMPAFVRVLDGLLDKGHKVSLLIICDPSAPFQNYPTTYRGCPIDYFLWDVSGLGRAKTPIRLYLVIKSWLKRQRFDFVYGQGTEGVIATIAANKSGISCGQRLYGIANLLFEFKKNSLFKFICKHSLYFLSFTLEKDFLIVTEDGSKANELKRRLNGNKSNYKFLHWCNGVEKKEWSSPVSSEGNFQLFYPGSFRKKKQQLFAVKVMEELQRLGISNVKMIFSGPITDPDYYNKTNAYAESRGLSSSIEHLGYLNKEEMASYYRESSAVLSFQEISNRSNCVLEALAHGALLVVRNDGSLADLVEDGISGILADTPLDAANKLKLVLEDFSLQVKLRKNAFSKINSANISWNERVANEISLIESISVKQ